MNEEKLVLLRYIDMMVNIYLKAKQDVDKNKQAQSILTEAIRSQEQQIEFIKSEAIEDFLSDSGV